MTPDFISLLKVTEIKKDKRDWWYSFFAALLNRSVYLEAFTQSIKYS